MAGLPSLASSEDLEALLMREFDDLEAARVEKVLSIASDLVRDESGKSWLDPDDPSKLVDPLPGIVRIITLRCAERAVRNPEGYSSESAGDYSYQRGGSSGEGGLFLTEREIARLRRVGGRTGLVTQPVTRGDCFDRTEWVSDQYGYKPIPIGVLPDWF
jgi:hypothetical protein